MRLEAMGTRVQSAAINVRRCSPQETGIRRRKGCRHCGRRIVAYECPPEIVPPPKRDKSCRQPAQSTVENRSEIVNSLKGTIHIEALKICLTDHGPKIGIDLLRDKLAVSANEPIDVSAAKLARLRAQRRVRRIRP